VAFAPGPLWAGGPVPLIDEGIAGHVAMTGETVNLEDVYQGPAAAIREKRGGGPGGGRAMRDPEGVGEPLTPSVQVSKFGTQQ